MNTLSCFKNRLWPQDAQGAQDVARGERAVKFFLSISSAFVLPVFALNPSFCFFVLFVANLSS